MNAIRQVWASLNGFAAMINRLTAIGHRAADELEYRVDDLSPKEIPAGASNGRRIRQTVSRQA